MTKGIQGREKERKREGEENAFERPTDVARRGVTSGGRGIAWLQRYAKNEEGNDPNSNLHGLMEHLRRSL